MTNPNISSEEELNSAINALFYLGVDVGKQAKVLSRTGNSNALSDEQKVNYAKQPYVDRVLYFLHSQQLALLYRVEAELGLDVESFGAIPSERVKAALQKLRKELA